MKKIAYYFLTWLAFFSISDLLFSMDTDKEMENPKKNRVRSKKNEHTKKFSEEEINTLIKNAKPLNNFSKHIVKVYQKHDILITSPPIKKDKENNKKTPKQK